MSREIVVRAPNWLGDVVMSTPALRALREAFPSDRITLQLQRSLVPLLEGSPWLDAIVPFDGPIRGPLGLLREARRLGAASPSGFDLGICIPDSWSAALVLRAAGVRRLVGYPRAGRGWMLHHAVPVPPGAGPRRLVARERYALGLAEAAGAVSSDVRLELHTGEADERRADELLAAAALPESGFVAIAPGASFGPAKRWAPASFARVADALQANGLRVCLLGAPGEEEVSRAVASAMESDAADLTGRIELGALKALLRRARALLGNDAGARHVAVAFGVPCVVLMGPTSLAKTDCNLDQVRVIETNDVDCRPCYRRTCPIDHRCMTRLEPDRVRDAVLEMIGSTREEMSSGGRRGAPEGGT